MNRIKMLRTEKNLFQKDLGQIVGITDSAIGLYENEKRDIPTDVAKKLASYFRSIYRLLIRLFRWTLQ